MNLFSNILRTQVSFSETLVLQSTQVHLINEQDMTYSPTEELVQ